MHHQEKLPCIFSSYFTHNRKFHRYNTRTKDSIHYEIQKHNGTQIYKMKRQCAVELSP